MTQKKMKYQSRLTLGMTQEEEQEFLDLMKNSKRVLTRIKVLLDDAVERSYTELEDPSLFQKVFQYDKFVAHNSGYRKALKDIQKLLTVEESNDR